MSSDDSEDDTSTIVLDIGAYETRANFAGEDCPRVITSSQVDYHSQSGCFKPIISDGSYDIDNMEVMINFCFNNLMTIPHGTSLANEKAVLLSEKIHTKKEEREKLAELMFEQFTVPGYLVESSPLLSLYSSGRGSGLILESGYTSTETLVVYEGYIFKNSIMNEDIGSLYINKFLGSKYPSITSDRQYNVLREKFNEEELKESSKRNDFTLPDGTVVNIERNDIHNCLEGMFNYSSLSFPGHFSNSFNHGNLQEMVYNAVMGSPIECRSHVFTNIILAGGNTLISGFKDHLQKNLEEIIHKSHTKSLKTKVIAAPERKYFPWIGGSIVGSLSFSRNQFMTKEMYEENGAHFINKHCPQLK